MKRGRKPKYTIASIEEIARMSFDERCAEHDRLTAAKAPPLNKRGKLSWGAPDFGKCSNDWWKLGLCQHCMEDGGCDSHKQKQIERMTRPRLDFSE